MSDLPWADDQSDEDSNPLASRVLIVDDEVVVLDVMNRLLAREKDLLVSTATTAEQAVALLKAERFEILITDKNLPGMSGIELIEYARRTRPTLEAMMITGYASGESVISAFAAGASDYLLKPFEDLRAVRAKIRAALDRRKERSRVRHEAQSLAREAQKLLAEGKDAPEQEWQLLEAAFKKYEQRIASGGRGTVALVGTPRALDLLGAADFDARRVGPTDPFVQKADVVVLETTVPEWRQLADKLVEKTADLVLLASAQSDLADLLEAISLRLELVGYGGKNQGSLGDRVRALLMRRGVQDAQAELREALQRFRQSLQPRE